MLYSNNIDDFGSFMNIWEKLEQDHYTKLHPEYRFKPADFKTFVNSPLYLGLGRVYRKIQEIGATLTAGNFRELIFVAGYGSGKSFLAELLMAYYCHVLLCLRDPREHYGLEKDKPIIINNLSLSKDQALYQVFEGVRNLVSTSSWFMKFAPEIKTEIVRFHDDGVWLLCGSSRETGILGYNIFFSALDEAAFYNDNRNRNQAENMYGALQGRIASRFGVKKPCGCLATVSSPKYDEDFIMRKLKDVESNPKEIFAVRYATWEVKDRDLMDKETFDFKIDNKTTLYGIPVDFKLSFDQNPEKALRDLAAYPPKTLQPFDRDSFLIRKNHNPNRYGDQGGHPFRSSFVLEDWFTNRDQNGNILDPTPRYIHIDLGLNREAEASAKGLGIIKRRGDAAGLAMGKLDGWARVEGGYKIVEGRRELDYINRPLIYLDFYHRIEAEGDMKEIDFDMVRGIVFEIKRRGFRIALVSIDGFQSIDTQQILKKKGIDTEEVSIDRTAAPYNCFKEVLRGRLDYYIGAWEGVRHTKKKDVERIIKESDFRREIYKQKIEQDLGDDLKRDILVDEYEHLELIDGRKVDHRHDKSKDVTDAIAGVCYCIEREAGTLTLSQAFNAVTPEKEKDNADVGVTKEINERVTKKGLSALYGSMH